MPKQAAGELLIIECDSNSLARDRLQLGSAFYQLLDHDLAKLFRNKKTIVLLQTSTKAALAEQFAGILERYGRFRAILIVGHSNTEGIRIAEDEFFEWRMLGHWLAPFAPELIFLAACEAGKSVAVRDLFEPLRKTLRDVYASPVKLYGHQAAGFGVLIARLLWSGEIDENESLATRLLSYLTTGGQIVCWSYEETGDGHEDFPQWRDNLAKALDFGPWDLQKHIGEWIERARRSS